MSSFPSRRPEDRSTRSGARLRRQTREDRTMRPDLVVNTPSQTIGYDVGPDGVPRARRQPRR
jgi:hypothetical protein